INTKNKNSPFEFIKPFRENSFLQIDLGSPKKADETTKKYKTKRNNKINEHEHICNQGAQYRYRRDTILRLFRKASKPKTRNSESFSQIAQNQRVLCALY